MDTQAFADYVRFREQVQVAFETYHIEAATLTVDSVEANERCLIGRVVWRSTLLKLGKQNHDAVHLTVMDASGVEITGTAWAAAALAFHEVLETGRIYKFTGVVVRRKTGQSLPSRLAAQQMELRFSSGAARPERINQDPYPSLEHSAFRTDYDSVDNDDIVPLLGVYLDVPSPSDAHRIVITNGPGRYAVVQLSKEKFEEFKTSEAIRFNTIVGFYGVRKSGKQLGFNLKCAEFVSFVDTVIIRQPDCEAARYLSIWCNQLVVSKEVEEISS